MKTHDIHKEKLRGNYKSVAIVSGKGGSGKTMISVALAQAAAAQKHNITLIDADFATGGLTYYLTLKEFENSTTGLSTLLEESAEHLDIEKCVARATSSGEHYDWIKYVKLIPVGDQRAFTAPEGENQVYLIDEAIKYAESKSDYVIVDCRGGIDANTIAVCSLVDSILIVAETDATALRTTMHLMDKLNENEISHKVLGFIINKAIVNTGQVSMFFSGLTKAKYIASVPFDIEATRANVEGFIPKMDTIFYRQIASGASSVMRSLNLPLTPPVLSDKEIASVALRQPEIIMGNFIIFVIIIHISIALMTKKLLNGYVFFESSSLDYLIMLLIINALCLSSTSDRFKQNIGRMYRRVMKTIQGKVEADD